MLSDFLGGCFACCMMFLIAVVSTSFFEGGKKASGSIFAILAIPMTGIIAWFFSDWGAGDVTSASKKLSIGQVYVVVSGSEKLAHDANTIEWMGIVQHRNVLAEENDDEYIAVKLKVTPPPTFKYLGERDGTLQRFPSEPK